MTHEERERKAREFWKRIGIPGSRSRIGALYTLLADTERAVLEDVVRHIEDQHERDFGHRRCLGAEGEIVVWLRQRAKEIQP